MKRTKKNLHLIMSTHDRPLELKWATALHWGVTEGISFDEYSKRAFERLPQQTTEEIGRISQS